MPTAPPLSITFIYHPADSRAEKLVNTAAALVDGLGIERAGMYMRVPIRVRCIGLTAQGQLRPISPTASTADTVIYCQSHHMDRSGSHYRDLLQQIMTDYAARKTLLFLPVLLDNVGMPPEVARIQGIRWYEWKELSESQSLTRALIRIFSDILRHLDDELSDRKARVFISHAKWDGKDLAQSLVEHIRNPAHQLGLETFYDSLELHDGEDFSQGLEQGVRSSALLALVTDTYESRTWCKQEILLAKQSGRAVLIVDVGRSHVDRTFPYLGNLPLRTHDLTTMDGCDAAVLDLVIEMLRVELFVTTAHQLDPAARALPRPPELLDLVQLNVEQVRRVIYPAPPLPNQELALLKSLAPDIVFETLDEVLV